MIDWWFMVQMVFIVGIFGFHIFLDKWLQKKKLEMQLESPQQVTEVIKSSGSFVKTLNIGGGNGGSKPKYTANTCPVLKKAKAWNVVLGYPDPEYEHIAPHGDPGHCLAQDDGLQG